MDIQRIAAFSKDGRGGNPAGVVIAQDALPAPQMQAIAAQVGYSETVFASPAPGGAWQVRYFSPESEVPFCGHATIALGAALAQRAEAGAEIPERFELRIPAGQIAVEAGQDGITLTSPPTRSAAVDPARLEAALALLGLTLDDLDPQLPPAHIHAGADHLLLPIARREVLARMGYDLDAGRALMQAQGLVTIMLVHIEGPQRFAVRNAFASGGVLEDPATGAAAAAFAGYLRDQNWPHGNGFRITQGEDMGAPSEINVTLTDAPGSPVRVSGRTRVISE
ncbi:MAG: PhzF family phenazine biosynthesis protein [Sulfitobacter sp.]